MLIPLAAESPPYLRQSPPAGRRLPSEDAPEQIRSSLGDFGPCGTSGEDALHQLAVTYHRNAGEGARCYFHGYVSRRALGVIVARRGPEGERRR